MLRPPSRRSRGLLLLILGVILASGCAPSTLPAPTPADATSAPEMGGWNGRFPGAPELWPDRTVLVYAVRYTNGGGQGFYLLDTATSPKALLGADGAFTLTGAAPGQYLLAAGPNPAEARLAVDAQGQKRIFESLPGVTQPLGDLDLGS